jgi:hypothetical protein
MTRSGISIATLISIVIGAAPPATRDSGDRRRRLASRGGAAPG